jgi:hypothetical protein
MLCVSEVVFVVSQSITLSSLSRYIRSSSIWLAIIASRSIPSLSVIILLLAHDRKHKSCSTDSPFIVLRRGLSRLPAILKTRSGSSLIGGVEKTGV